MTNYKELYEQSISDPDTFWGEIGKRIDWFKPYTKVKNTSFNKPVSIKWYEDGVLNASYNCLDRHLDKLGDKTALICEADEPDQVTTYSFKALHEEVCKFANVLKKQGVKKGDRVTIYMPMIAEAVIAMLSCARIGAVHSVVFGGFSPDSLANRILDCDSKVVVTANAGKRGGKLIPLKDNVDKALEQCPDVSKVIVFKRLDEACEWGEGRDVWWHEEMKNASTECPCEEMQAEDPLFILYTSGSTGKPKGVLHTTGGYMVYASYTHDVVFDTKSDDVYWCTADVGWITGHSYIVYGPLANATTNVVFEGVPQYPDWDRFWQIVEDHKVTKFYTAPTAIRALLKHGDQYVSNHDLSSLKVLGTVGEPINVEAWHWYKDVVGGGRCPIVDTWWQTETGGHMMTPLVDTDNVVPGYAMQPFFGIKPELRDESGKVLSGEAEGALVIADSWPGQMRTVFRDHTRFEETYFSAYPGAYFTGDGAKRDENGRWRITGRMDDVLNVSGHRLGTAEIESAIGLHEAVAEASVVGFPHEMKGQGIFAAIILKDGHYSSEDLANEIKQTARQKIGPICHLDKVVFVRDLPKTRSGKIMRRILRKIAAGETENLGDTSTLADPTVVKDLLEIEK